MRIVLVARYIDTIKGGGANYSLTAIASQLAERGHDVTVIAIDHKNVANNTLPFDIQHLDADGRLQLAKEMYRTLSRYDNEADIFHIFNTAILFVAGMYKKREGKTPIVGRLNIYTELCSNMSLMDGECHRNCGVYKKFIHDQRSTSRRIARVPMYAIRSYANPMLIRQLDKLFAISPTVKQIFDESIGCRDITTVIPNFYDPSFVSGNEIDSKRSTDTFRILFTGRIEEIKGVDILLHAIEQIDESDIEAHIVGDGSARAELQSECDDSRVTFHGWVPYEELSDFYTSANVFVHPGRWPEPFGRTILEALQCQCPAIVSNMGAPPWVVGNAGISFPPEDAATLAEELLSLKHDEKTRVELEKACRYRLSEFDPEKVISDIEKEYRKLVIDG
jgi:glycosyltransferase involved in cell wall biosynthesis